MRLDWGIINASDNPNASCDNPVPCPKCGNTFVHYSRSAESWDTTIIFCSKCNSRTTIATQEYLRLKPNVSPANIVVDSGVFAGCNCDNMCHLVGDTSIELHNLVDEWIFCSQTGDDHVLPLRGMV